MDIYRHEREQRHRAYLDTRPLRDEFPRIAQIIFRLHFTDARGLSSYSAQMRTFAPAANAFFEIACPSTACIGGGFSLDSVVSRLSNGARNEMSGTLVCQGRDSTDERDPHYCNLELHYDVAVAFLSHSTVADHG